MIIIPQAGNTEPLVVKVSGGAQPIHKEIEMSLDCFYYKTAFKSKMLACW